ncbi:MAG: DUF1343 domain-containing protein, partial [Ignavibacteria bacterium]|nr:DUF1343 domain-containing protein [Ignavibacteria bacterium]
MMKKLFFALVIFALPVIAQPKVQTGLEVLKARGFDILKGKRVGLVTNPTGVDSHLKSTIDVFFEQKSFQLKALFGPEHGVRGDVNAGDAVDDYIDSTTGIPVYSLYGKNYKPKQEWLKDLDILVYDIQDIGCRSYTYISTMSRVMEAASERGIPVVILDRPNPLGGERVEGNIVEQGFFSGVSQFPIPYVYGLTCGELATYLNKEKILKKGVQCELIVVPMDGWKRDMIFQETGLPWVLSSPHVPNAETAFYYVATGILGELEYISEGVGYTMPFQLFGAPWINSKKMADKMNSYNIPGVIFRPLTLKPYYGFQKDKNLGAVQIHIMDFKTVPLMKLQFLFLQANNELYPEHNPFPESQKRWNMF